MSIWEESGVSRNAAEGIASPRLERLQSEVEAGHADALDDFWREIEAQGTPLVEAIESGDRAVLMTLLYRHSPGTRSVAVVGGLAGADVAGHRMRRLPGTDVWYLTRKVRDDLRTTYQISPNDPLTPLDEAGTWEEWLARTANWMPDPLNPRQLVHPRDPEEPDSAKRVESVIELPGAPPYPWTERRPGVPEGTVELHRIRSKVLDGEYRVWVYTPPGYTADGEPCDLLVLLDGRDHLELIPAPVTLDNLLFEGSIRPTVAAMVESPTIETRMRDLACYPPFAGFLADELMSWVRGRYRVTPESGRTIVGGVSLGGLAAAFAALERPDVFGNVLSQSGAFWWKPDEDSEPEWMARRFATSPRLPLRFYLDVGLMEPDAQLSSNRRLRDVLRAKGYLVRYVEYNGAHDYISWRGLLGDGLAWLAGPRLRNPGLRETGSPPASGTRDARACSYDQRAQGGAM